MILETCRRLGRNRRQQQRLDEPIQRRGERRGADRRDFPRAPRRLSVHGLYEEGSRFECEGNLTVGGAYFHAKTAGLYQWIEVRFQLPDLLEEVRLTAEVIQVDMLDGGVGVHVVFLDPPVKSELALARFIENRARLQESLAETWAQP